ncbi:hypothetical protein RND71_013565 [Anisodus tanguticus]|uniref:Longin domain-containing protein n=1 Tax=Anisodus tanguticus TaxID=243964 RepID=A0AAE1S915_9SOLA|nr:hypothetical protein RND71_013565 [Anisodus tanguticus]
MGSVRKALYYCSVSKGGQLLYAYNGGDHEIKNLAALCLERIPSFHKWYFQTMAKKTFGFLMEGEGYVYFAIVDEGLGNAEVLKFLQQLKDEFRKLAKKGWRFDNALLLGKPSRQEKKKMKDHVIAMRDTELEEHQKSTEQVPPIMSQKELCLVRSAFTKVVLLVPYLKCLEPRRSLF